MTSHSADGEVSDQNSVTATASVFAEPCASKGNRCATRYPAHTGINARDGHCLVGWQGENQQVTKQHANVASRIHLK